MKLNQHKAYTDSNKEGHRVILVKNDNTVLKVLNKELPTEEVAKAIAQHWNEEIYKGKTK